MEEDGRPAASQLRQQPAKTRGGAEIDLALGSNPLVAAPPARICLATSEVKRDFGHRRQLDHAGCGGWRGGRRRGGLLRVRELRPENNRGAKHEGDTTAAERDHLGGGAGTRMRRP